MPKNVMRRILVTGATGQIGSELVPELRRINGDENVIVGVHRRPPSDELKDTGPCEKVDVTDKESIEKVVDEYEIDTLYHMAAILSAGGEKNPWLAWDVNMNGTYNVLEVARERSMGRVFIPSSIAAFGPETPRENTPQETILKPRFYEALKHKKYTCFLSEDSTLPMMYMPDCIKATVDLMDADLSKLKHHTDFNLAAISFSPKELVEEIKKHIPELAVSYEPDSRQAIADSWPKTIDDSAAREEWGWKPSYDLAAMTEDMLKNLRIRYEAGQL
jgi:nucleoside-diphosphate-sugar epimerase